MKLTGKIHRHQAWIQGFTVFFLFLLMGGIYAADPSFYPTVFELSKTGDMDGTIRYLSSFGIWAAAVSFFIDVMINILGFLPSIFISAANGLVFGLFWGIIISWIGETVGVLISFWLMRTLFMGMAVKMIEKSARLAKIEKYSSWKAMAVARAIPYAPNGLITALAAFSGISYRDYIIGSLIGKLPSVAVEVIIGHDMIYWQDNSSRLMLLLLIIALFYAFFWLKKRKEKRIEERGE